VYSAVRESDGRAVVLKFHRQDDDGSGRSRAQSGFDALRRAAGLAVVEAVEFVPGEEVLVLVVRLVARFRGVALARALAGELLFFVLWIVEDVLELAILAPELELVLFLLVPAAQNR
jgi:hypothetical protein